MQENDTIVQETPMINVDELDSVYDNEPSVVVTEAPKAQSSKRKRDDKEEEEYEIYAKTNSERASIWQHFLLGTDMNLKTYVMKFELYHFTYQS